MVTTTTHKTLRGPRGGMVLTNDAEIGKKINSAVFPGLQGGPLMHVIAAKAVAFGEALTPEFRAYQQAVADNAKALAATLVEQGLAIVTGGTDSHLMLVDLRPKHVTGKAAEASLDRAHITANKNAIPFDPEKPAITSGLRLGTPAATTRGFGVAEFQRGRADDRRGAGGAGTLQRRHQRGGRAGGGRSGCWRCARGSRSTRGSAVRSGRGVAPDPTGVCPGPTGPRPLDPGLRGRRRCAAPSAATTTPR